ncbi:hypothetical protein SK128_022489, partial [Halocaridina rubra]
MGDGQVKAKSFDSLQEENKEGGFHFHGTSHSCQIVHSCPRIPFLYNSMREVKRITIGKNVFDSLSPELKRLMNLHIGKNVIESLSPYAWWNYFAKYLKDN